MGGGGRASLLDPKLTPCSSQRTALCGPIFAARLSVLMAGAFSRFPGPETLLLPGAQMMADGVGGAVLIATPKGLYEASRGNDGRFSTHPWPLGSPLKACGCTESCGRAPACGSDAAGSSACRTARIYRCSDRRKDCRETPGMGSGSRPMVRSGREVRRASTASRRDRAGSPMKIRTLPPAGSGAHWRWGATARSLSPPITVWQSIPRRDGAS